MYEYLARLHRVIDGDTIDVDVDLGFQLTSRMRLRLRGINAPEVRGAGRVQGRAARVWVEQRLPQGARLLLRTYKVEKYGRYLADVRFLEGTAEPTIDQLRVGTDLAEALVREGLAVTYMADVAQAPRVDGAADPLDLPAVEEIRAVHTLDGDNDIGAPRGIDL